MKLILLIFFCVSLSNTTIFASQNHKNICGEFTAHELLHMMIDINDMNTKKAEPVIKNCVYDEFDNCALFSKSLIKNRQDLIPLILQLETKAPFRESYFRCSMTPFIANARTHPDPVGMAQLLHSKGFKIEPLHHNCSKKLFFGSSNPACDAFDQLEKKEKMKQGEVCKLAVQQRHDAIIAQLKKIE